MTTATETLTRKLFTEAQANQTLQYVSSVVADICSVYAVVVNIRGEKEDLDPGPELEFLEGEYDTQMDRLGYLVDELHAVGCELRDFETGHIDFPCQPGHVIRWEVGGEAVVVLSTTCEK